MVSSNSRSARQSPAGWPTTWPAMCLAGLTAAIGHEELQNRVLRVYAGIVAADLRDHPFAGEVAERLDRGEEDPRYVVERLGLRQGAFLHELRERLMKTAGDEAVGRALALLVCSGLEKHAWAWLSGGPSTTLMTENYVPGDLRSDYRALVATAGIWRLCWETRLDPGQLPVLNGAGPEDGQDSCSHAPEGRDHWHRRKAALMAISGAGLPVRDGYDLRFTTQQLEALASLACSWVRNSTRPPARDEHGTEREPG